MTTNRHGFHVEADSIRKIEESDNGYYIDRRDGWGTLWLSKDELNGFVPQVGDAIVLFTKKNSTVVGVIIENHVIRYKTANQYEQDRKDMFDGFRLQKLERYVKHGEALKARVEKLPTPLRERMHRFAEEDGVEFWIDSADYEMAVMEGAAALLNTVNGIAPHLDGPGKSTLSTKEEKIQWINDWWDINSDKHDPPYDYKKQMELVPDFGDGHSGFTASAARSMAIAILEGKEV